MSTSYVGEVRLVGFNFAPVGWAFCDGSTLSIAENSTLFNLIGTIYGGNGQTTFNLPDLRGRVPIHQGSNGSNTYVIGQPGGVESVTVVMNQFPAHNHALLGTNNAGTSNSPASNVVAKLTNAWSAAAPSAAMNPSTLTLSAGGNQPHENRQPYQVLNWVISLYGVYPSQG